MGARVVPNTLSGFWEPIPNSGEEERETVVGYKINKVKEREIPRESFTNVDVTSESPKYPKKEGSG